MFKKKRKKPQKRKQKENGNYYNLLMFLKRIQNKINIKILIAIFQNHPVFLIK